MSTEFNKLILQLLTEAEKPPLPPSSPEGEGGSPAEAGGEGEAPPMEGGDEEFNLDDAGMDELEEEPALPEEIELAKLAVRSLYFNPESKSVHKYALRIGGEKIPFEKISDYFEETKNWKPILGFVEHIMDKFEGLSSKWTEQPDVRGKGILDKIKDYNKDASLDEQLDNGKRSTWVRIIINALLYGRPSYNLSISDVNEKNLKEIYRKLKQDFGEDSRGLMPNNDLRGPGVF
mgnify:CR=1 FL=1